MKATHNQLNKDKRQWGVIGAIISAVVASVCCLGPLVLLALGIGGAWIGNLTAFEAYRPFFMVATLVFLGFAFYKVYRQPKKSCEIESYCANPKAERINKTILWVVTVLVLGLLALPYALPYLASANQKKQDVQTLASCSKAKQADSQEKHRVPTATKMKTVILDIQNMTCGACPVTIRKSLKKLDGILDVKASLKPPRAIVIYDPSKVDVKKMIEATTNAGYPSSVHIKGTLSDKWDCCSNQIREGVKT